MSVIPKTIQIYLPNGEPTGIRIAEITTRIVQVIEVPRNLLADFLKMPESDHVSLYFLIGEAEEGEDIKIYIGQTGSLRKRLAKYNQEKAFWTRALIVISRTNSFTQTHTLFLEWYCIQAARKADRYADENGNAGSKPHTPAPFEADCLEVFETSRMLLATLGYPIFDPVATPQATSAKEETFYCTASQTDGRGLYTSEGFVVRKGSKGILKNAPSISPSFILLRERLLKSGIIQPKGTEIIFTKDHLFGSPSTAAVALLGRNTNGWTMWKNADGQTLDEVKRKNLEP